jgi:hypothetical protein
MSADAMVKTDGAQDEIVLWTHDDAECATLRIDRLKGCVKIECSDGFYICSRKARDDLFAHITHMLAILEVEADVMSHF